MRFQWKFKRKVVVNKGFIGDNVVTFILNNGWASITGYSEEVYIGKKVMFMEDDIKTLVVTRLDNNENHQVYHIPVEFDDKGNASFYICYCDKSPPKQGHFIYR